MTFARIWTALVTGQTKSKDAAGWATRPAPARAPCRSRARQAALSQLPLLRGELERCIAGARASTCGPRAR
ncbi:hypothetical protein [Streptomyces sp. NPDC006285]|uniref:hypothetical protein n=1 Tax=Streptomyces sp. NPDC006285 TaxID=3364742 RepID=UPI0036C76073